MFLDGQAILYLFNRLSPFLIVSYFVLNSILQLDYKGLIYISGLLLASTIAKLFGDYYFSNSISKTIPNENCNLYTLGVGPDGYMNHARFSKVPLSLVVFSYSFAYLLFFIITSNLLSVNFITVLLFIYLIIMEFYFLNKNNCSNVIAGLIGCIIGTATGIIWAFIIKTSNNADLYYYNGINNASYCTIAKERKYKCTFK